MQLLWWSSADRVMAGLEADPARADVLRFVRRTLGRLELDPFDPRLRTRQFVTEGYGQMRSTPVGFEDWRIMWKVGPEAGEITIAFIAAASS